MKLIINKQETIDSLKSSHGAEIERLRNTSADNEVQSTGIFL